MKLELGGGENPRKKDEGFLNVDILVHEKVDKNCDFENQYLPFASNTVDEIWSYHLLEHIGNAKHFLNECHRVLKKGGTATFIVPYGLWAGAQKPVHKQCITECWFDFLRRSGVYRVYGFKRWEILEMEILLGKSGEKYEIICKLTPYKK